MTHHRHRRHAGGTTLAALLLSGTAAAAQGLPPVEMETPAGGTVRVYGQLAAGILGYDDGLQSRTYGPLDNASSPTRLGLGYSQVFGAWAFENVSEIGYGPFSTANASIANTSPDAGDFAFTNANIRKLDFSVANDRAGKVWIGQGSMATDGIQEIDLSGTDVVAYSSVGDSAGGQILRFSDGTLSDATVGSAFTNYDGPRRVRVRYDTPERRGVTFAAAYGRNLLSDDPDARDQDILDASLTYASQREAFEVEAGLGYYWQEDDRTSWGGSASALHKATGLNATLGFGTGSPDDGPDGNWWYGKLGLLRHHVRWGPTALSIDVYQGTDFFLSGDATSSSSRSWGLAAVQTVARANTDLYLTYRSYDYSDDLAGYRDGQALFGGVRFKF